MWKALINQGVNGKLKEIIRNIYDNSKAYIKTDKKGGKFNIGRAVRQGAPRHQIYLIVLWKWYSGK